MTTYQNRRTFCIVSHPDAGKTTITEKLLLFGGAIHEAGTVKARKAARYATSDWMEIEKQRGISVTSSVMQFDYMGFRINLLDTPGHHDFSEDTYRVLTAVDSALMVIDGAKGIEEQTKKLMRICSDRKMPVITFINKLDREGRNPLELLDEIESVLGIRPVPRTWPAGSGKNFRGVYQLHAKKFSPFSHNDDEIFWEDAGALDNLEYWEPRLPHGLYENFKEQVELVESAYGTLDKDEFLLGKVTPVFFGSALNNFGVETLLQEFCHLAPQPGTRFALERAVEPQEDEFTAFIFKIQANMDARHRDRIAFARVCSGRFEKGMEVFHVRQDRKMRVSNTFQFMASKRSHVEEAYAGDVIGMYDTGDFKIGDTLTEREKLSFLGIPNFAPELFRKVILKSPLKSKQLRKGLHQLCEEGASQVFFPENSNDIVIGVVGQLQFEVIRHRLENEYGVDALFEAGAFRMARWVLPKEGASKKFEVALDELGKSYDTTLCRDNEGRYAILVSSEYALNKARERFPDLNFADTSEVVSRS